MSLSSPLTASGNSAYKICFYLDCWFFGGGFSPVFVVVFLLLLFVVLVVAVASCFYFVLSFVFFKDFKMLKMGFLFGVLLFPFLSSCPHFKSGCIVKANFSRQHEGQGPLLFITNECLNHSGYTLCWRGV